MKSLNSEYLQKQPITHNLLQTIRRIAEYKGKQDLYREQSPQVLETLRQAAIIQSTESSNRLEGITAPLERIKDLVAKWYWMQSGISGVILRYVIFRRVVLMSESI